MADVQTNLNTTIINKKNEAGSKKTYLDIKQDGIIFSNVLQGNKLKTNSSLVIGGSMLDIGGDAPHIPVVNAIDIDWNNAYMTYVSQLLEINTYINTSGKLLSIVDGLSYNVLQINDIVGVDGSVLKDTLGMIDNPEVINAIINYKNTLDQYKTTYKNGELTQINDIIKSTYNIIEFATTKLRISSDDLYLFQNNIIQIESFINSLKINNIDLSEIIDDINNTITTLKEGKLTYKEYMNLVNTVRDVHNTLYEYGFEVGSDDGFIEGPDDTTGIPIYSEEEWNNLISSNIGSKD